MKMPLMGIVSVTTIGKEPCDPEIDLRIRWVFGLRDLVQKQQEDWERTIDRTASFEMGLLTWMVEHVYYLDEPVGAWQTYHQPGRYCPYKRFRSLVLLSPNH